MHILILSLVIVLVVISFRKRGALWDTCWPLFHVVLKEQHGMPILPRNIRWNDMFLLFEISFKLHKDKLYANLHQVAYSALNIFVFGHEIEGYMKKGGMNFAHNLLNEMSWRDFHNLVYEMETNQEHSSLEGLFNYLFNGSCKFRITIIQVSFKAKVLSYNYSII